MLVNYKRGSIRKRKWSGASIVKFFCNSLILHKVCPKADKTGKKDGRMVHDRRRQNLLWKERKERSPPPIFLLLIGSVKSVPCGSEEDVLIREDFLRAFCLNTGFFSFLDLYLPFVSGSHHCLNNFHIPCPFKCFSYIRCIQWSSCTVITHDIECTEEKPNFERETWNFQLKGWSWNIFPS